MKGDQSLPTQYFDDLYAKSDDPWGFETSDYEQKKYAHTIAMLPEDHYDSALEIGCSIGVLTGLLAERCDHLLSIEPAKKALDIARNRLADNPHIQFEQASVPKEFPSGNFDLIVMSEVGYYLSNAELQQTIEKISGALNVGGSLVLVHWTHGVEDYPLTGDEVHTAFLEHGNPLEWLQGDRTEDYRIDVFEKA